MLAFAANGSQLTFTGGPFGSFVYLRADVAGVSGHGTPVGGVTFSDTFGPIPGGGVYQLNAGDQLNSGSNTATPNGILNFDTGTHTISASYSGDGSFDASSTITSQTFTITAGFYPTHPTPSTVLISAPGVSGLTSFSVSSSTGFSGTIALSCSGLPATAACQFSPSSVAATGSPATIPATITVTTMAPGVATLQSPQTSHPPIGFGLAGFALFSLLLVGVRGKHGSFQLLLAVLALIMLAPGCGGGGGGASQAPPPPPPGTPAGTYNVVVAATSGSTNSNTGFTLIVQ